MAVEQLLLQAPQLSGSAAVLISQPLPAMLSQLVKPVLHMPMVQAPLVHVFVALAKLQAFPHIPQCAVLVFVSTSQPLPSMLSQLANEPSQLPMPQVPLTQASTELGNEHGELHAPQ